VSVPAQAERHGVAIRYGSSWHPRRTPACAARPAACPSPEQTTPVGKQSCPADETVTVVDPCHPLYGHTLRLLGMVHRRHEGPCCVAVLHEPLMHYVPLAATDRALEPPLPYPLPLSVASVHQLLASYARIAYQPAEDTEDDTAQDHADQPHPINAPGSPGTSPSQPDLGAVNTRSTTARVSGPGTRMPEHDQTVDPQHYRGGAWS
jgi:hypothetical protein